MSTCINHSHANSSGMALVFVLILVAVATVIGSSLLAESAITAQSNNNQLKASALKYASESGIHHAACLLRENPAFVKASLGSKLGPYSLADGGQYYITITALTTPGYFRVTSTASAGTASQSVTAVLRHTHGMQAQHGCVFLTTNDLACIMPNTKVYGQVHSNRDAYNFGVITGDLKACTSVYNFGLVNSGSIITSADTISGPITDTAAYSTYQWGDNIGFAEQHNDNEFSRYEDVRDSRAITSDNPAGVVMVTPASGYLTLKDEFDFNGTLVVLGHLIIEGSYIDLNPQRGFPAILATGSIYVKNNAEMEINGTVISKYGFGAYDSGSSGSNIDINGALVSWGYGNYPDLQTNLVVRYDSDHASLYDPTGYGTGGHVLLISWQ